MGEKKSVARTAPRKPANGGPAQGVTKAPHFDAHRFLTSVGAGRSSATFKPKEIVYRQGDAADAVYYIEAGKIQLTVISEQGKEGVIAMLEPGEFFGEGCIAGQPFRMASATATARSTIIRIEKAAMIRVLHEQPAMSEMFMAFLLSRNIQIEADLIDQLFNSSERRLARLLLLLANFGKEGKLESIIPTINQDILAAKVGTTRSRINFFMNKFRKLGFIEYNGGLKIHTSLLNVIVHDQVSRKSHG
ncbi:Crp/Fnr family transcriptional regulator [Dongia deserti]|uniref:Crp/Fnr family transcriptional regulator n=1 Tax=Dongia deserti TaxID=2268030 RepID=UPI00254679CC|nr:Crp/Fnr family transcriptional regulator [Dongia deserti]